MEDMAKIRTRKAHMRKKPKLEEKAGDTREIQKQINSAK
jgi:hypothetical protein